MPGKRGLHRENHSASRCREGSLKDQEMKQARLLGLLDVIKQG